jgi:hypothetical protein
MTNSKLRPTGAREWEFISPQRRTAARKPGRHVFPRLVRALLTAEPLAPFLDEHLDSGWFRVLGQDKIRVIFVGNGMVPAARTALGPGAGHGSGCFPVPPEPIRVSVPAHTAILSAGPLIQTASVLILFGSPFFA